MPDDGALGDAVAAALARLAAHMRAAGAHVGLGELLAAHRALAAVDAASREDAYLALRAVLCSSRRDLARLRGRLRRRSSPHPPSSSRTRSRRWATARRWRSRGSACPTTPPRPVELDLVPVPAAWSEEELLRHKDFAAYTDAERAAARRLLARLARRGPRRLEPAHAARRAAAREVHDLRATVRALAAPRRRARRAALPRAAPSGRAGSCSCATSRARWRRTRGCCSSTCRRAVAARAPRRGVRVRHAADARDARARRPRPRPRAGAAPPRRSHDWSGGTRIGDALGRAQPRARPPHRPRRARRRSSPTAGTAASPSVLAAEMARLQRCAHRVVWLNPLAADPALRAADARHAGGDAARRPPARRQLDRLARGARRR